MLLAAALQRLGDIPGAIEALESSARVCPRSASLQLELGRLYGAADRVADARRAFEDAVDVHADFADAWNELSTCLLAAGEMPAADRAYERYRRLVANPADLREAYAAFDDGRYDAANQLVRQRLRAGTSAVAAHTLLSAIASRRGDDLAEEAELHEILQLAPCDNTARERLARLLLGQGRAREALILAERLVRGEPGEQKFAILKAESLRLSDRHAEGLEILVQSIAGSPGDADLWLLAGNQQRYLGRPAEAIEAYRRCVQLNIGYGAAYLALSNLKTFRFSTDDIAAMRRALAETPSEPHAANLHFAIGKALEDEGRFAESFQHYALGNRGVRASFTYNADAQSAYVRRFKTTFDTAFFSRRRGWGSDCAEPIFIVGLPRSGSTLLEQILASHSQIEGTRELPYVPAIARELAGPAPTAAAYPESLRGLNESDIKILADRYLALARRHRLQGKPRFIDKMHGNFASIGLIHLMFPRAVIIDARRHPMACGFACYKQLFAPGMNFAYDLTEIGLYYRDYEQLMRHIDEVLPGRVWRAHYENVVTRTDAEIRRLLDHCGLDFEPDCLRFHENRRVAQTLSSEQVRQPMYTDGLQQWRHYEDWLDPLKSSLGNLAHDCPDHHPAGGSYG